MTNINTIKDRFQKPSNITPVFSSEMEALKSKYPGIPVEYTEFLEKIGYGDLGNIRIYEAPTSPCDIFPMPQGDLSGIVLFGDDFQGYCFGFDTTKQFSLVEVDPRGNPRQRSENGFLSFIDGYLQE